MCKTVKTFKKLKCLLTFGPSAVSASQTAHQAEPARSHLRHLQQGVQEQLQPAAAPVGAHGHQDEGPRGAGEGGRSEGRTGGEADGPSVPPPPHPADATSSSSTPSDRHRRRRCRPGVPAPPAPPARSAARQPREPAGLRVHRHGNCNYGCTASTHPGSCCCRGLHGAESESPPQHQPGEEEPRLRGVREGLQRRLPPQPPPSVPLGREAVLLPHLPAALQEERPHELPRALAPRRRGETLRLSSLRQGLLSTGPPQQPRPTGALYRETVQVHDVHVGVRHAGSSPRPPGPSRGEGAVSHLWEAAVCRVHHRPHEGPQPVAAPRLSPLQPQLHNAHLPACPRSEAPRPGVEGERRSAGGLRWDGGRGGAALPAVRGAVQDGHAAPGSHGHPRQPGGPGPRPDHGGSRGHHQRGRHRVQRQRRGTAGNGLLRHRPAAPQLARWEGQGGSRGRRRQEANDEEEERWHPVQMYVFLTDCKKWTQTGRRSSSLLSVVGGFVRTSAFYFQLRQQC
ncbi:translation initiation factor IF-2 isoform X2 [Sebastes umbrosus]|uniref:translation initiation factor IF-2 isoform X2 n=1 Tax=Sebastes umbrosus TaxID=72105 RepID=UPI00189F9B9A|nr:translation initiation factor IF-2 isoform X2 [Sebastes umbrosus]